MVSIKNKWNIRCLGDHALVFSLPALINEKIANQLLLLNHFISNKRFSFIKDLIPAYHTLTLIYDIETLFTFLQKNNFTLQSWAEKMIADFEVAHPSYLHLETKKIIQIPVCYDTIFGIDLENIKTNNKISIEEIIKTHFENIYTVYCLGFLPGFTYMGIVNEKIIHPRHSQPRAKVIAGSVGIAVAQTGIYPTNSPGGWQIIGRTPLQIFDRHTSKLALFNTGDQVQFYPISLEEFHSINQHEM